MSQSRRLRQLINHTRVKIIMAFVLVILTYQFFRTFYSPWNMAGRLNMPEALLSILLELSEWLLYIALGIAFIFPEAFVLNGVTIYIAIVTLLTFPIAWPLGLASLLVHKATGKKLWPNRLRPGLLALGTIMSSVVLGQAFMRLSGYTEALSRLGSDPIHQAQCLAVLVLTDVAFFSIIYLWTFRNLFAVILCLVAASIEVGFGWGWIVILMGWFLIAIITAIDETEAYKANEHFQKT